MKNYNWAVLGTGVIANETAAALQKNGRNLFAVGNRTHGKAVAFAEKYNIGKVYDSYDEMFTDPDVDIIYITTPHNTHYGFMKKAILNKKHILVEKSITLNSDESRLSREQTRFIFETNTIGIEKQAVNVDDVVETANHFRCIDMVIDDANRALSQAMIKRLHEILKSGTLGRVNLITMNFGSFKEYNMKNRFFNRSLAGGAMLDIGVYALSVIRWFFDSKPDNMLSQLKTAPTGVDEQASLLLSDKEGQMATVMLSLHSKQPKRAMISCENGYIEIMEYPRAWEAKITYTDGRTELVGAGENSDALYYEITDMEKAVNGGKNVMCLDYTADVMEIMTRFRQEHGIIYPEEE